jgi:hypothetical protein
LRWSGGYNGQADGLAVGVGAVILADCLPGRDNIAVGYVGSSSRAASPVIVDCKANDGSYAVEEILGHLVLYHKARGASYLKVIFSEIVVEVLDADFDSFLST